MHLTKQKRMRYLLLSGLLAFLMTSIALFFKTETETSRMNTIGIWVNGLEVCIKRLHDAINNVTIPQQPEPPIDIMPVPGPIFPDPEIPEDGIYLCVDQPPRFPGCQKSTAPQCAEQKLFAFIYENLRLPSEAINAKIEGRVIMQFIIEPGGEITNVRVVRDIGYGCGNEAMRVVNLMNYMDAKWVPGKHNGKNVRVKYHLPITFKLM